MDVPLSITSMTGQDSHISGIVAAQGSRLRRFIRRHVPAADVEDILQEVFAELVEANRLLMPIDHVAAWLFRVARNRITDLWRRKRPLLFSEVPSGEEADAELRFEDLLPSPDAGPEALLLRRLLVEELERALDELPREQREVFLAHEVEGRSFKELSAASGVSINTLLSRKRYAVLHLRERLKDVYEEFLRK
jgi:RNA polymerase sigma factor (sigma-70 family)